MPPKTMTKAKILMVDDHPVFREGLVLMLNREKDLEVCGEADSAVEAIQMVQSLNPDLILMDISLEGGVSGLDVTKMLKSRFPAIKILVLSMHNEALHGERALRAGAQGYIMKRQSGRRLLEAVRQVLRGQVYISPEMNELILQRMATPGGVASGTGIEALSDRELEIFQLIGQGYGTRQIADALHISMKTIETHREHIREKLNLENSFELVQRAIHWMHREKDLK